MKTLVAALRASNGQLLTVTQTNSVLATSAAPGPSEFFTLIHVEAGKVALRSSRGFVCLKGENAALVVGVGDIAQAEVFTQVDRPDGTIALLASNGKYVCAEGGGGQGVFASRAELKAWEVFRLVPMVPTLAGKRFVLRSNQGKYVQIEASDGRTVAATAVDAAAAEVFTGVGQGGFNVALQARNGRFVGIEPSGAVVADRQAAGPTEIFKPTGAVDGSVALRANNEKFVCAEGGGGQPLVADRVSPGSWEFFHLVEVPADVQPQPPAPPPQPPQPPPPPPLALRPGTTWRDLFGAPDFTDADPGRSVVSPAAYLADLLQLLEDELAGSADLDARRPDIARKVVLNGESAFSPVPQLDIVNRVLSARVAAIARDDADKVLAAARHPLELPFEPHDERLRRLLPLLKTAQHELYAAFARDLDVDVVARARLGLSPARAAILLTDTSADPAALRLAYGLAADADLAALTSVAAFRRVTGLDADGLRALLSARLSGLARDRDGMPERDAAGVLFVHQGLGGHVALDDAGEALVWRGAGQGIPPAWFDRVHRLLRLSRWIGVDLIDLDLALRQLCDGKLDGRALRHLAVLVDLRDRTGEPIDALCAILGELGGDAALGASDDPATPGSLFDRVFNGEPARLARRHVPSGCTYTPPLYAGWERLEATGDLLADDGRNRELRARIQRALGLSARDVQDVVTRLRDRAAARARVSLTSGAVGVAGLTALYRVARLARLTDLGPLAVLDLLDVLEGDPGLRRLDGFDVLVHLDLREPDLYRVLEQGPVDARVWLVQHLLAVAAWATAEGLTPADLAAATRTDEPPAAAAALSARGAQRVRFRVERGQYIGAEASGKRQVLATAATPGAAETFTLFDLGEGRVTLQASTGLFLGIDPAGAVLADRTAAGPAETFTIEGKGSGRVALRANNGKYLCAEQGGGQPVLANRVVAAAWETFRLTAVDDRTLPAAPASSAASRADDELLRLSQALLAAFQPVALRPELLIVDGVSPRAARLAVDLVREPARGLVAAADPRIVTWDADAARAAAHDVLTALDVVTVADLEELQLGDALAGHLAGLLVRRGLLDREGVLRDDRLPERAEDLVIETDWGARTGPVLALLKTLRDDATARDPEDDALALFPVDLAGLGFERAEADELIEHLTFLELLDESGAVTVPDVFDDLDDPAELRLGLGLHDHRAAIHEFLAEQRDRWLAEPLRLPDDLWAELPLTDGEREALEQNLAFNGHIDGERRILDRAGLLARTPDDFDLALPFYRHRRKILAALQGFVAAARTSALTLDADRLRPLADRLVAASVHAALSGTSLDADGRPNARMREFLGGERRVLDVGPLASIPHIAPITDLLRRVVGESEAFRLTEAALAAVDLTGEHATRVFDTLVAEGVLRPDRTLVPERLQAFTRVRGALDFSLRGYTDYARDVFFLLHDVAVATEAHVAALTGALRDLAAAQSAAMHDVLPTALELPAPAVDVLLRQLLRDVASPTAAVFGPVLAAAGDRDTLDVPPADRRFTAALRRARQFAGFAARLRMSAGEIEVAFRDQQLVEKFPEPIALPDGVDRIDVLWTSPEGLVYLFCGDRYWTFDAASLAPRERARPLTALLPDLADAPAVDALFTAPAGDHWLLAAGRTWRRAADGDRWAPTERVWGQIDSRFRDPAKIDGALIDDEGRLCLFAGDQYVRYSTWPQESVDEGYPRRIAAHWPAELGFGPLPAGWSDGIDAAVGRPGEVTWLFRGDRFVASTDPGAERPIVDTWGRVRHDLASASRVDAVLDLDGRCAIVVGDQVTAFDGALERPDLVADPGFPRTLAAVFPSLPEAFAHGVDAGLVDQDGTVHLFRDQTHARRAAGAWTLAPAHERWGRVRNNLQATGRVDAALCGLDGKVYLFSGDQYVRYSSGDLGRVDEGYPRTIARDWGGLVRVDAAFALDGKTYVFGRRGDEQDDAFYLRFSSRDYRAPDVGYPRPTDDNFWNLPQALVERFAAPQAVFVGPDGRTYLFSGDQVISFAHNHRWWTEPAPIREVWSNLPFDRVTAAFTARDGRTYFFSDEPAPRFVRYTDPTFARVDDRFPRPVQEHWGKLVNNLARTGRVDAAITVVSPVPVADADGVEATARYRYLFSGDQFVRYSSDAQEFVDEGYPRRIHDALRQEPHFANLDAPIARGVDGVWADAGNVLVFVGDRVHVASTAHLRQPAGFGVPGPRAVDLDEGALTVFSDGAWRSVRSPESLAPRTLPAAPRPLRGAPAAFQGALTAILRGLDGNVYLFAAERCWDPSLARDYPTGAAWGLVRNRIAEDGRVDAALWGRDGKLHLFRGDQCLAYTPAKATPTVLPALADAAPTAIAARWGGLGDVRHAFVRRGVTYLLAAPDERGAFRYVRYSGPDYTRPDDPEPLDADGSFWRLPAELVDLGFDRPDAVFAERDDLLLIRGRQFVHHRPGPDGWSAPRSLALRWPGLPTRAHDFDALVAIAGGPDGATHFFSTGAHLAHDGAAPGELAPIASRWGRLDNRLALTHRVDAALVDGEHTFLFSGDQYVRYTGSDYRYVDPDYPRPIAGRLRDEDAFRHLPADLEASLARLKPGDIRVEAACAAGGTVYLQIAGRTFALSRALRRDYPLSHFGRLRNDLLRRARVDAAFRRPDGALYLLSGEQYVRYSGLDLDLVDDGYPRRIADDLLRELADAPAALPAGFTHDLDATFHADQTLVLFKDRSFVRFDTRKPGAALVARPIADTFGRVRNTFLPTPQSPAPRIDAAFIAPDGALLVFKGDKYLRYSDPAAETADEGFPAPIRDHFGDLPPAFEAGIDAAFAFDGRWYMGRGAQHVRFADPTLTRVDPSDPQPFAARWRRTNDYSLRDLRIVQRYVALDRNSAGDVSLTDFLRKGARDNADPYALLAARFDWEVADVQWLKRRAAFLDVPDREEAAEVRFDLEQLLRIHATMELARRLGLPPRDLFEQVWQPLYGAPRAPATAADALGRALASLYPGADGATLERQLGDALRGARRDALVAWLMAHDPTRPAERRDLGDLLLTDVDMDPSAETSVVREAIGALQLYFHRYALGLDRAEIGADDEARRERFKRRWRWLKNYRVWEANRRVFLFPESYVRPELRDTRTAAFRTLQDDLVQGEITDASVTQAYKKYLDEYTEVSRLVIAGGFVQPGAGDPTDRELMLFGFTRTQPRRYYYRHATFFKGDARTASWRAWRPLGVEIGADRVHPVRAFGRAFVFWVELTQKSPAAASAALKIVDTDGGKTVSRDEELENHITVSYSFYDLNERWSAPQRLKVFVERGKVDDLRLGVTRVDDPEAGSKIVVACHYGTATKRLELPPIRLDGREDTLKRYILRAGMLGVTEAKDLAQVPRAAEYSTETLVAFGARVVVDTAQRHPTASLTADLEVRDGGEFPAADRRTTLVSSLFAEPHDAGRAIELSATADLGDGPWYSVDIKGASFLALPTAAALAPPRIADLANNGDGLPTWDRVDACLVAKDGAVYLFRDQVYARLGKPGETPADAPLGARWGLVRTAVLADQRVDAAWWRDGVLYLARGAEYLTYSSDVRFADPVGPRPLPPPPPPAPAPRPGVFKPVLPAKPADPPPRPPVPDWPNIHAAFTDASEKTWFFRAVEGRQECVTIDADLRLEKVERPWGLDRNEFTRPLGDEAVVGAFSVDGGALADKGRTFLIGARTFTWYEGRQLDLCEPPRPQSLRAVLELLGATSKDPLPDGLVILGVLDLPGELVFKVGPANPPTFFRVKDRAVTPVADPQAQELRTWLSATSVKQTTYCLTSGGRVGLQERRGGAVQASWSDRFDTSPAVLLAVQDRLFVYARGQTPAWIRVDLGDLGADGGGKGAVIEAAITRWNSDPKAPAAPWVAGRTRNAFSQAGKLRGALRRGDRTFLLGGDAYVRYTGDALDIVDEGYPRPLKGNPDGLPEAGFDAAVDGIDGRTCFFLADRHAFGDALATTFPLAERWGQVRTNILTRGVDAAHALGDKHYLFSGDEVAVYTADAKGELPRFMDGLQRRDAPFYLGDAPVRGALPLVDRAYLFRGAYFHGLAPAGVVDAFLRGLGRGTPLRGGWDNLPALFHDGVDAGFVTQEAGKPRLVLFRGGRYAVFVGDGLPCESGRGRYDLVRLTSATASTLNRRLFEGGVAGLLGLRSQLADELPGFSATDAGPALVKVNPGRVNMDTLPTRGSLDFTSANGLYYWEIFFHAPLLIADTLRATGRHEDARAWYQHVYDPTAPGELWKFLPFLTVDLDRLVARVRDQLARGGWRATPAGLELEGLAGELLAMAPAFRGERDLAAPQLARLAALADLAALRAKVTQLDAAGDPERARRRDDLLELVGVIEELRRRWDGMQSSPAQLAAYLDDPLDPHAIAALRPIAYRKAAVLNYIGNLLDWGDALFAQYTRESIDQARMLYVQAWDLLGRRPESLGRRALPPEATYGDLRNHDPAYDLLLVEKKADAPAERPSFAGTLPGTPHASVARAYFFIPTNDELHGLWTRVADRLHKLRHGLDLQGLRAPLALFEPPLDPAAAVRAVAAGGLAAAGDLAGPVDVPHHRFAVLFPQAQALADRAAQLATDLLLILEKRDAEELSRLQSRHEGEVVALTAGLQRTQLAEAEANRGSIEKARENAQRRLATYDAWLAEDYLPLEKAQLGLLTGVAVTHFVSAVLQGVRTGASAIPRAMIGLFIAGVQAPESERALDSAAAMSSSVAAGLQSIAEILGVTAQHERMKHDWKLQRDLAAIDVQQFDAQLRGADHQIAAARQQIAITERQIAHNDAVATFYRSKFTSRELYQWMLGRLTAIHHQTYQLALNLARAAERAYQFERGVPERDATFIRGQYWDAPRQGLTAGAALGLDLARMQAAFLATDARRFEIGRRISLIQLDPLAFLRLKAEGSCEFDLDEALFDRDFPGHFARQIKTVAVELLAGEGVYPNATLTQLGSRVVMEPDARAVAFLLEPTEAPPPTIRHDWRARQQAVLSRPDDGEKNNGVFSRFDTERYLPFEGTGAVSRWRLELGGRAGAYDPRDLLDVVLDLKYTARPGGEAFAAAVRGLLKPTDALRCFDLAREFADAWGAFLAGDDDVLTLTLDRSHFPDMASGRIGSIFTRYVGDAPGAHAFTLEGAEPLRLADGKTVDTGGALTIRQGGTTLTLRLRGGKAALRSAYLVMSYKEGVR